MQLKVCSCLEEILFILFTIAWTSNELLCSSEAEVIPVFLN